MSLLVAKELTRDFVVYETRPGLSGAIRGLFGGRTKKTVRAVDRFSFSLESGEIVGLIGPNGAGKSTMVKMAVGILPPSSGTVELFGVEPFRHRVSVARHYGVVFGQRSQLWWNLSPRDTFTALAAIYEIDPKVATEQIAYLTSVLELGDFLATPVRQLSLGQRVRCDIAAALLHQPKLILDEPTVGVDVVGKERLRGFIRKINQERGVTILLTSHDMVDIERLCGRVLVINKGQLAYAGPLEDLRRQFSTERQMILDLADAPPQLEITGAEILKRDGQRVILRFNPQQQPAMDILAQVTRQCEIRDFSINEMPIDEVISRIYQQYKAGPVLNDQPAPTEAS